MTRPAMTRLASLLALAVALPVVALPAGAQVRVVDSTTPPPPPLLGPPRPPAPPIRNTAVAFADSMLQAESVVYDADADVYFASNINGGSLAKDGNGFLSRLKGDGSRDVVKWVESGRNGARLDAPKGLAIVGDTVWVTDIDVLRGFHRRTGAMIATLDLAPMGAAFLNDIAVGPDGALYVTDTEMAADARGNMRHVNSDRVFRVGPDRRATIALQSDRLARPNGIAWDARGSRFVIVPFGGDTLMTWRPGDAAPQPLVAGPGRFDGVAVTPEGRLFVVSQATAGVHELVDGKLVKVLDGLMGPADLLYDTRHRRLGVPLTGGGRVVFFDLPPAAR